MNYIEFDRLNSLNEFALNSNKITLGEYEQQKEVLFNQALSDEREKTIDEVFSKLEFLRDYKIDSGKLIGVSIGDCFDAIAEQMKEGAEE